MQPTMMMALAHAVERERQSERQNAQVRSRALADRGESPNGARSAIRFARRIAGISLRPRLS